MLPALVDLKVAAIHVRLNRAVVENGNRHLRIRGFRAKLVIRIAERLANRVDANKGTRGKEVLALQRASAHGVLLRPHGVHVLGEELGRGELVTGVAASRRFRIAELRRASAVLRHIAASAVGIGPNSGLALSARSTVLTSLSGIIGSSGKSRLEALGTLE